MLGSIVDTNTQGLNPDASLNEVSSYLASYNLLSLPVIDANDRLLGAVTVDDVLDHLLPENWRHDHRDLSRSSIKVNTELCLIIPNVVVTSSKVGNDKFFIYTGDVKEFSCKIYNRWGNLMSQMSDLHSAWECKNSNGQLVDEGTYLYAVRILYNNGTEANRTGYFEVKH